jgi:hypothetical protein
LLNPSVVQNETFCTPSPCGRLSRPRTTTGAPPPSRLIGRDSATRTRPIHATAILGWASLVPLVALKRFRLDSDLSIPISNLLFLQTPTDDWLLRRPRHRRSDAPGVAPTTITLARLDHSLARGRGASRTASVLAGMGVHFPEGTGRFLFSSHTEALPSRTATAMKHRLCPTLSGELFRQRFRILPPTYSLGTMAGQTATVCFQTLPRKVSRVAATT